MEQMHQIVYVVTNDEMKTIPGVYNTYEDALASIKNINSEAISITPVLVDAYHAHRDMCYTDEEVRSATANEINLALVLKTEEKVEDDEEIEDDEVWANVDDNDEYEDEEDNLEELCKRLHAVLEKILGE